MEEKANGQGVYWFFDPGDQVYRNMPIEMQRMVDRAAAAGFSKFSYIIDNHAAAGVDAWLDGNSPWYRLTNDRIDEVEQEAESRKQRLTKALNDIAAAFGTSPNDWLESLGNVQSRYSSETKRASEAADEILSSAAADDETKILRIHWRDACSVQGRHFQHEIEEQGLSLVESVGWLVGEDDSCVKLAISVSDGVAGNMTIIPKSGIVDRWEFKGE